MSVLSYQLSPSPKKVQVVSFPIKKKSLERPYFVKGLLLDIYSRLLFLVISQKLRM